MIESKRNWLRPGSSEIKRDMFQLVVGSATSAWSVLREARVIAGRRAWTRLTDVEGERCATWRAHRGRGWNWRAGAG